MFKIDRIAEHLGRNTVFIKYGEFYIQICNCVVSQVTSDLKINFLVIFTLQLQMKN